MNWPKRITDQNLRFVTLLAIAALVAIVVGKTICYFIY